MPHPPDLDPTALPIERALQLIGHAGLPVPDAEPGSPAWLQQMLDALCELSSRDALTGLANRRSFELTLAREIDRVDTVSLADEVLVVATPEPTSLTDAYATIKVLATQQRRERLGLVVNQAAREGLGRAIHAQLHNAPAADRRGG